MSFNCHLCPKFFDTQLQLENHGRSRHVDLTGHNQLGQAGTNLDHGFTNLLDRVQSYQQSLDSPMQAGANRNNRLGLSQTIKGRLSSLELLLADLTTNSRLHEQVERQTDASSRLEQHDQDSAATSKQYELNSWTDLCDMIRSTIAVEIQKIQLSGSNIGTESAQNQGRQPSNASSNEIQQVEQHDSGINRDQNIVDMDDVKHEPSDQKSLDHSDATECYGDNEPPTEAPVDSSTLSGVNLSSTSDDCEVELESHVAHTMDVGAVSGDEQEGEIEGSIHADVDREQTSKSDLEVSAQIDANISVPETCEIPTEDVTARQDSHQSKVDDAPKSLASVIDGALDPKSVVELKSILKTKSQRTIEIADTDYPIDDIRNDTGVQRLAWINKSRVESRGPSLFDSSEDVQLQTSIEVPSRRQSLVRFSDIHSVVHLSPTGSPDAEDQKAEWGEIDGNLTS